MATKKVTLTAETELQPDVVLEMLTKRGLIGDQRIANEKAIIQPIPDAADLSTP